MQEAAIENGMASLRENGLKAVFDNHDLRETPIPNMYREGAGGGASACTERKLSFVLLVDFRTPHIQIVCAVNGAGIAGARGSKVGTGFKIGTAGHQN